MENEKTVVEPGTIIFEVPADRKKNDDDHTGGQDQEVCIFLINDNISQCAYVTFVLVQVDFGLSYRQAEATMYEAHCTGDAPVGVYSRKVAEQLLLDVAALNARCGQYPRFVIQ